MGYFIKGKNSGMIELAIALIAAVFLLNSFGYINLGAQAVGGGAGGAGGAGGIATPVPGCGLDVAQNTYALGYDAATHAAITGASLNFNVYEQGNGLIKSQLNLSTALPTNYGRSYNFYGNGSGYFSNLIPYTAPCNEVAPNVRGDFAAIDTSTVTFLNEGGIVQNTGTNNQTFAAGAQHTVTMRLTGAASNKYMTDPVCGKFYVGVTLTNNSEWDTSLTNMPACTKIGVSQVGAAAGEDLAFLCNGNVFNGEYKDWQVVMKAKTSVAPITYNNVTFSVRPIGNTLSSSNLGSMPMGCVVENDAGSASYSALTGTFVAN